MECDFGDFPCLDAVRPYFRLFPLEGHNEVVPIGIGGRDHISWARVRLSMGVAMHDSPDLKTCIFSGALGPQMVFRVNRVDACLLIEIATWEETGDRI